MPWKIQSMTPAARPWWHWLALSAVVIVLDHITKVLIQQSFMPGETRVIAPFFNLVLAFNTGAAFSFLADAGGWQRQFFIVLTIAVSVFLIWLMHRHPDDRTVTVISGTYFSGIGETFDPGRLKAFPPGSFYFVRGGVPHFSATREGEVIIQESGAGPGSGIEYVHPEDDPRPH